VLGLKQFLRFAEHGASMLPASSQSTEDHSLIVEQIAEALRRKGYEVKTAVGSSALRVDLAIIDPLHSDRYALGIICDGSSYVQLKTARDREVVQPRVLQMLGWHLMHVWTVDWLQHPEVVIDDIVKNMSN
jgi:very-short-patch-repair endonuclease